jgi:hypothetical protein
MTVQELPRSRGRLLHGTAAVMLGDLVVGMTAYCTITLGALWYFSYSWTQLHAEYGALGVSWGSDLQLALAWIGILAILPLMGIVLYLGWSAIRLPAHWLHGTVQGSRRSWLPHVHDEVAAYHCPMCSRTFSRIPIWDRHVRTEHAAWT